MPRHFLRQDQAKASAERKDVLSMEDVCRNGGLSLNAGLLSHISVLTRVTCIMDRECYVTFFSHLITYYLKNTDSFFYKKVPQ